MIKKIIYTSLTSFIVLLLFVQNSFISKVKQPKTPNTKNMINLIQVRDSLFMLEGQGGNTGVLIGTEGILLVDDKFHHVHKAITNELSKISAKKVKYIINTHWHFDHSQGNENFAKMGSIILSQENSRKRMSEDQHIHAFNYHQKHHSLIALPKITFKNNMDLYFNNELVHLESVKNAHTDGDLFVHFKTANVIHAGDVFVTYGYPFIDQPNGGSIYGVISAVNKILSICNDKTLIIPGHGTISNKKDLLNYKQMLLTILDRIELEFKKGKSINEIIETHPTRGYFSHKINEKMFVEIVVNNLKSLHE